MKLESWSICVACFVASSCTSPPVVEKFFPLGPGCGVTAFENDTALSNAMLDVAAGDPQVFVGVRITAGEVSPGDGDRPNVTRMVVTYGLSKRLGGETSPFTTPLGRSFDDGVLLVSAQLISPQLGAALFDALLPQPSSAELEDFIDVLAEVEFHGEYASSRLPFTTTALTYPIRAFRSQPATCPGGRPGSYVRYQRGNPCGYVGQTSSQMIAPATPVCCSADSPVGSGC